MLTKNSKLSPIVFRVDINIEINWRNFDKFWVVLDVGFLRKNVNTYKYNDRNNSKVDELLKTINRGKLSELN